MSQTSESQASQPEAEQEQEAPSAPRSGAPAPAEAGGAEGAGQADGNGVNGDVHGANGNGNGANGNGAAGQAKAALSGAGVVLKRAGQAVAHAVDRAESRTVPAVQRAWGGLLKGVDRAETKAVPVVLDAGGKVVRAVDHGEAKVVPGVQAGASAAARGVQRGEQVLVGAATSTGGAVAEGVRRGEQVLVGAASAGGNLVAGGLSGAETKVLGSQDPDGPTPPWGTRREEPPLELFDITDDEEVDHPLPTAGSAAARRLFGREVPREDARRLALSLVGNVSGLLFTAVIVVLVTVLVGQAVVPTAAEQSAESVSAELILPENVGLEELSEPSTIFAGDGTPLATLDQEIDRNVVPLDTIPMFVRHAVITAEDRRFYEHNGYDAEGIGRALLANYEAGEVTQGGSTITQQLAKSIIGGEITLERKVEELVYAVALEERFSKDELLEQYLNQVYFGRNSYGIDAAAHKYFNVSQEQLTLSQAALLAAMIRSPNTSNPDEEPELVRFRRNAVLDGMVEEGYITPAERDAASAEPLGVVPVVREEVQLPFIVDAVQEEFLTSPEFASFGASRQERQEALHFGGLQLYSSLDRRLQTIAQDTLRASFTGDPEDVTGAIATVEPSTGRILAASGALRYEDENFNLATQARRQAGSTYKPFVYAAALQAGLPESTPLSGRSPTYFDNIPGWTRREGGLTNYGNSSYGQLNMRSALTNSVNTATVQLGQIIGTQRVMDLTGQMGINVEEATLGRIVDSNLLGGLEVGVTPLEMASAYGTFANNGVHVRAHWIDRIVDRNGNEVYRGQPPGVEVLQPQVNATMVSMMQDVVNRGTGTRARIRGWAVAGKTGTTNRNVDAWFVGYTPTLSTAMWYGYEQGQISTGQTGGQRPAQIWNQYMTQALAGQTPVPWPDVEQGAGRIAPGQATTVPDVRRLPSNDALRLLLDAQLLADVRQAPSNARAGTVIAQSPAPGNRAVSGDRVRITVSTGQPPAPSPTPQAPPPPGGQQPGTPPQPDTPSSGGGNGGGNGGGGNGPRPPVVEDPPDVEEPPEPDTSGPG